MMRMYICNYDARAGSLATILRLSRSVIPGACCRLDYFIFFGLHVLALLLFMWGTVPGFQHNSKALKVLRNQMAILSSLTVFFEVFYTQACFKRYVLLYELCRRLLLDVGIICSDIRLHLMAYQPMHARLSVRYMLLCVVFFFQQLNQGRHVEDAHTILVEAGFRLMLPEEQKFYAQLKCTERHLVAMVWAVEVVSLGAQESCLPANVQMGVITSMFKICDQMQLLASTANLLMPFKYFHLLNLMVSVNLAFLAYVMAANISYTSVPIYLFAEIVFMGMMFLASQLSDPFGADKVDFPWALWLRETICGSLKLLEYERDIVLQTSRAVGVSRTLIPISTSLRELALREDEFAKVEEASRLPGRRRSIELGGPNEEQEENEEEEEEADEGGDDE